MRLPDPYDPALPDAFDHLAFYTDYIAPLVVVPQPSGPILGPGGDEDTGLRCWCGREIVATDESETGWSHVGIGDRSDA